MYNFKIEPEGWNNRVDSVDKNAIDKFIESKRTLQGIVNKCDDNYNLYVNLGNSMIGIMPRNEVEAIIALCTPQQVNSIKTEIDKFDGKQKRNANKMLQEIIKNR